MLLICAIFLATITAAVGVPRRMHWGGLSLGFLYLSADETSSIHEKARPVLANWLRTEAFSDYTWVVLYGPLVVVFVLAYLRFLRDLLTEIRLLLTAGFLYVGGALGMEVFGGLYASLYGNSSLAYLLLTHAEELLEMCGVTVFIYSLLLYLGVHGKQVEVGCRLRRTSGI